MNRKNKNEGSLAAVFFSQRHTINLEEGTNEKRATGELVASRKRMHKTEQKVNWFDKTSKFALCCPSFFLAYISFSCFCRFFLSNTNDKITQNKPALRKTTCYYMEQRFSGKFTTLGFFSSDSCTRKSFVGEKSEVCHFEKRSTVGQSTYVSDFFRFLHHV